MLLKTILFIWLIVLSTVSHAKSQNKKLQQDTVSETIFIITSINITGNKKTKPNIILCELEFKQGDTLSLSQLNKAIDNSRTNLLKISIFNYVTITADYNSTDENTPLPRYTNINIEVEERWYTWPLFDITPHNGNLNDWISNHDFSKIDYLIGIKKYNLWGRRQNISLSFKRGFNNITEITYQNISLSKNRKHYINANAQIINQKSLTITTENNKAKFVEFDNVKKAISQHNYYISYTYRPQININNTFSIGHFKTKVYDSVAIKNPNYLGNGKKEIQGLKLSYEFKVDRRNSAYYPLKGSFMTFNIAKYGFFSKTIDTYNIQADLRKYFSTSPRTYFAGQFCAVISSNYTPFNITNALGNKPHILPGYEHNIIAGSSLFYVKTSHKYELIKQHIWHWKKLPFRKFNKVHYALYLNTFVNSAYVYSSDIELQNQNSMNNAFLGAIGIGLDLVTYYDKIFAAYITRNVQGGTYVGIGIKSSF